MTRKDFDRLTKHNYGKPLDHWEYRAWVRYRERRLLPHPGYAPPAGTDFQPIPHRLPEEDPYRASYDRMMMRGMRMMGMRFARSLNKIVTVHLLPSE